ncbi:MAG: WYL domain-containing protein [Vicinamibacterales bacterium]
MVGDVDGRLLVTLNVCIDQALRSWILSFGPFARVVAPESLAREIAEESIGHVRGTVSWPPHPRCSAAVATSPRSLAASTGVEHDLPAAVSAACARQ